MILSQNHIITELLLAIIKFKPQDATTNPSLLLAAAQLPQYSSIVEKSISAASDQSSNPDEIAKKALEHLVKNILILKDSDF